MYRISAGINSQLLVLLSNIGLFYTLVSPPAPPPAFPTAPPTAPPTALPTAPSTDVHVSILEMLQGHAIKKMFRSVPVC